MLVRSLNMTQLAKSETMEMFVFDISVVDVNIFLLAREDIPTLAKN